MEFDEDQYPQWFQIYHDRIQKLEHEVEYLRKKVYEKEATEILPTMEVKLEKWEYDVCSYEKANAMVSYGNVNKDFEILKAVYFFRFHHPKQYPIRYNLERKIVEYWENQVWNDDTDSLVAKRIAKNLQKLYFTVIKDAKTKKDISANSYQEISGYICTMSGDSYIRNLNQLLLHFLKQTKLG
jgi:hypothetical protein